VESHSWKACEHEDSRRDLSGIDPL
jgi:hypothetical protein